MRFNKKGDLREQVPEIVLVVLILVLLAFGVYKLYEIYSSSERDAAKNILESLVAKINLVKGEDVKGKVLEIPLQGFKGAENWFIVGFSKDASKKPQKCYFGSCLCICPLNDNDFDVGHRTEKGIFHGLADSAIESCQESGFCKYVEFSNVLIIGDTLIKGDSPIKGSPILYSDTAIQLSNSLEYVNISFPNQNTLDIYMFREVVY